MAKLPKNDIARNQKNLNLRKKITEAYWMLCGKLSEFYKNTICFDKSFYPRKRNKMSDPESVKGRNY